MGWILLRCPTVTPQRNSISLFAECVQVRWSGAGLDADCRVTHRAVSQTIGLEAFTGAYGIYSVEVFVRAWHTRFRNELDALKTTIVRAGIACSSPVFGFRPTLGAFSIRLNVPNPVSIAFSSRIKPSIISSKNWCVIFAAILLEIFWLH